MDFKKALVLFSDVRSDPYKAALEWKTAQKGKVIAHLLPDVPEEIIHAGGFFPLPVAGTDERISLSGSYLPSFICSSIKGLLETALKGQLDFIDGMVIPYVCDSTRAFSHVWESNFPHLFNHTLWLPKRTEGNSVKNFLHKEFMRMKEKFEALAGREITERNLRRSIKIYNLNRKLLRAFFNLRKKKKIAITFNEYLSIVKASMMMEKEESNALLTDLLEKIKAQGVGSNGKEDIRIFLLGSICEAPSILETFDQIGMKVVVDNLYNGTRYFSQDVDEMVNPIEGLVNRHLAKDPLSCFHYPKERWFHYLKKIIEEDKIDGVVYLTLKYCDPSEFDYPFVKDLFKEMKVPLIFLETDFSELSVGQMRTRLEAFGEMLRKQE